MTETAKANPLIDSMFKAGAHFGYTRTRRHPSAKPYLWGAKNRIEIFNLELTSEELQKAAEYVKGLAKQGAQILFVAGKREAQDIIRKAGESLGMPYVAGRWIGGTLTNFPQIRKQVTIYEDLLDKRQKGELNKYTKKERLLIDRKIEDMEKKFSGIVTMKDIPAALFIIDPRREHIAVCEAKEVGIPVIALCGSDCNLNEVEYSMPGNDAALGSISFFTEHIVSAFKEGRVIQK